MQVIWRERSDENEFIIFSIHWRDEDNALL